MAAKPKKSIVRAKKSTTKSDKKTFDFALALEDLKKSKSLANTKKKLEVIFKDMQHWENVDNILEKPADKIVQIGALLSNYKALEQFDFYKRILSDEFTDLRAKFDHYDLAYLYSYACTCFSRNAVDEKYLNSIFLKAQSHLEAVEIDKYGVEAGLRLYALYHNTRATDAYRKRDFSTAQYHLHESSAYCKKIISVSQNSELIERAQKLLYNLNNLSVGILIQQREFYKILEQKENLDELTRFVERSPIAWTRLFNLRGNYGVAELCLGRIADALQSFQFITSLCQQYQNLPMEESDDLQLSRSYECLALSLTTQSEALQSLQQHLQKTFAEPLSQSQKYYAFLVAWSELLSAVHNQKITPQIQSQFNKVQNLALQCQMQDFLAEWNWFSQAFMSQESKKWKEALKKAPFPMFNH